jgi:anti-sigma factor ChrR (cupin superfamily)
VQLAGPLDVYEDEEKGEMTCLLRWEPGASLPMLKHSEIEQSWVLEGSFYDHDGICRAGEFVWRHPARFTRPTRTRAP